MFLVSSTNSVSLSYNKLGMWIELSVILILLESNGFTRVDSFEGLLR